MAEIRIAAVQARQPAFVRDVFCRACLLDLGPRQGDLRVLILREPEDRVQIDGQPASFDSRLHCVWSDWLQCFRRWQYRNHIGGSPYHDSRRRRMIADPELSASAQGVRKTGNAAAQGQRPKLRPQTPNSCETA